MKTGIFPKIMNVIILLNILAMGVLIGKWIFKTETPKPDIETLQAEHLRWQIMRDSVGYGCDTLQYQRELRYYETWKKTQTKP